MFHANCPSCGAAISFRSIDLPVKVCDYCRSSVIRSGETLEAIGKVAEVPEDVSPLQLGTRGKVGAHGFEVIGRVRWRWTDGAWNEWLALFDDGSTAWLGESMGRFMLLREIDEGASPNRVAQRLAINGVVLGDEAVIAGTKFTVTDVKDVVCVASEGELPFPAPDGLAMTSVDLMAPDGESASIQQEPGKGTERPGPPSVYVGRYVSLADLAATNLRAFDGWPMPRFAA